MNEVITISDDELESSPPRKIIKLASEKTSYGEEDPLQKLNSLVEISTVTETVTEVKTRRNNEEENSLTIIIESDEVTTVKDKTVSDDNRNVVILDPLDDDNFVPKENISNDVPIVLDDESDNPNETIDTISSQNSAIEADVSERQENLQPQLSDRPSTSTASDAHKLLDEFLETCRDSIKDSKYESKLLDKFPKMKKHFNECDNLHEEVSFKRMLEDHIKTAKFSAPDAVVSFQRIYSYLLDNINGGSIEISEDNLRKVKKLESRIKVILRKIKRLEESEINFDDDEDSTYIQIDRYSQRLNKIYQKYCKLLNRDPHTGRLLYEKVHFVSSKHNEINRAITKTYKDNKFPSYMDIEKCIRKCVSKNNLPLSEADIKEESKNCFTKLGNLLQLRRKKELYEIHCGFITLNEDPANNDTELKTKLQESQQTGDQKMKEVVEKYVKLQENDTKIDLSEDSDDSNYKSSEDEEN